MGSDLVRRLRKVVGDLPPAGHPALAIEAADAIDRLSDLVQTLLDNDPTEPVADNGMTVLDAWRERARATLITIG